MFTGNYSWYFPNQSDLNTNVTKDYKAKDYQSPYPLPKNAPIAVHLESADIIQKMTDIINQKFPINSAYRNPQKNNSLKNAASASRHMIGIAYDIALPKNIKLDKTKPALAIENLYKLAGLAYVLGFHRFILYNSHLHVDMGSPEYFESKDATISKAKAKEYVMAWADEWKKVLAKPVTIDNVPAPIIPKNVPAIVTQPQVITSKSPSETEDISVSSNSNTFKETFNKNKVLFIAIGIAILLLILMPDKRK